MTYLSPTLPVEVLWRLSEYLPPTFRVPVLLALGLESEALGLAVALLMDCESGSREKPEVAVLVNVVVTLGSSPLSIYMSIESGLRRTVGKCFSRYVVDQMESLRAEHRLEAVVLAEIEGVPVPTGQTGVPSMYLYPQPRLSSVVGLGPADLCRELEACYNSLDADYPPYPQHFLSLVFKLGLPPSSLAKPFQSFLVQYSTPNLIFCEPRYRLEVLLAVHVQHPGKWFKTCRSNHSISTVMAKVGPLLADLKEGERSALFTDLLFRYVRTVPSPQLALHLADTLSKALDLPPKEGQNLLLGMRL